MDERRAIHQHRGAMSLATLVCLAVGACGGGGSSNERDAQPVLTSITVSPSELTLDALDATAQLEATARDQNGATMSAQFSWSSSDTTAVTVNADGLVTAVNNGSVTVTVRSGTLSASASVTVEQAPASIALSQDEVLLTALGAEQQLEANVLDSNQNAVSTELTWESSDPAVATVDGDGSITAQANGTVIVTATVGSISNSVTVTVRQEVASIELGPESMTLTALGQRVQLDAMALDANGHPVAADITFTTSESMVATVDATGVVTTVRNGMTTVTASTGSFSSTVTITVMQVLARITLEPESVTLTAIGESAQLQVRAVDANGVPMAVDVSLSSSDPGVASVNANGLVTALANGSTTITASVGPVSTAVIVTVMQVLARLILEPESVTLTEIGEGAQLVIRAVDANGRPMSVNATLSSSDPSVASVNAIGVVIAQGDGTATITATVRDEDGRVSRSVAITVQVFTASSAPLTVSGDPNVRDPRTGRTPLHWAAMANASRLIAALIEGGAEVGARDVDGHTPLHAAAIANAPAAIGALVQAGAHLEARSRFGETPIVYGARNINPEAIVALVKAGADPNAGIGTDTTALHRAASHAGLVHEHGLSAAIAMLTALLEAGADPNARNTGGETPLHAVATTNNAAAVRVLLEAGADPNVRETKGRGWSPLWNWVGFGGSPAIMPALLEAGADIEMRDLSGDSLLHLAAERDSAPTIVELLEAGADIDARDSAGRTALHAAASTTELSLPVVSAAAAFAVLLEAGADPDARDDSGITASQLASGRSSAVVRALLDAHAGRVANNPNARDPYGYTALHAAARANSRRQIEALLAAGANVDALDNERNTPLLLAAGPTGRLGRNVPRPSYSAAAIATLAAAGANLDARDTYGRTALHRAAIAGESAAIMALLEAGADPGAIESDGYTALQVALEEWAFDEGDKAAIVALAEAEANLGGREQSDFAAVVALAVGSPAALSDSGLNLNARDNEGRTVLHWVVGWDDSVAYPALAALLDAGADLNARDLVGRDAVHWAMWRRNPAMIAMLAEAGADLNVRASGLTALLQAILYQFPESVAALAAAGADPELRVRRDIFATALQLAAQEGEPAMIAALVRAGANLEEREFFGRTALQVAASRDHTAPWYGGRSTPAAVAALVEAGADINSYDRDGTTALQASATGGNQAATGILLALGASWTRDPDGGRTPVNARIVAVELFQGPMVWQWQASAARAVGTDHSKTLLGRATTVAVRIGSEAAEPVPELSVSLIGADGTAWPVQVSVVRAPRIASVPSRSESGLWETEYVYELPTDWVASGNRATLAVDPYNRLEETDESDNAGDLTMDGYTAPVFEVTFVPIVFSGDPPAVDTDTYMAVIADLLPIGEYRAQVGRPLDLSDRNLGTFDRDLSRDTAISELRNRWNAEAGENEYYHGLMSSDEQSIVIGGFGVFGGIAYLGGKVAVSDVISQPCQVDRVFCGDGVHAHELGHNFGLVHLPGRCTGPGALDHAFPYAEAGIGPRRGWVATRNEFVNPGPDNPHYDLMGYCAPRFVSDYNYNKMVDHRLGNSQSPPDDASRIGPTLQIGTAANSNRSSPGTAATHAIEELGPSLVFAGAVDEYGLWSIAQSDASPRPPRPHSTGGEYVFTLLDASLQEIYREPMKLLTATHGETSRSWAVRVPVPEQIPAFLAILDASGTPLNIEPIVVPVSTGR